MAGVLLILTITFVAWLVVVARVHRLHQRRLHEPWGGDRWRAGLSGDEDYSGRHRAVQRRARVTGVAQDA